MNKGIAMIGHESKAVNIRWGTKTRGREGSTHRAASDPKPRAKAIGIPRMNKNARVINKTSIAI